jgi:hypothetical protein
VTLNFLEKLNNDYDKYFDSALVHKRFTHSDVKQLINDPKIQNNYSVKLLGRSIENREIYSIEFGEGENTVLLWSQMHGDEPTATMALFDLLSFLKADDELNEIRNQIKKNLKLIFVPMLNPDGAERITRQNAAGIDLNRDAKRLQSPESKILLNLVEEYKPKFGFNLHDQDFRWSVGNTNKLAAISLLAPVYDYEKSINSSRLNAIKLVAQLRRSFEKYLPNKIARYKDDYEPRSFGDLIAGKNVSTVLIESGRDINDHNKFFYRKINFMMLLFSFTEIINNSYSEINISEYFEIPTNGNFMFDLILRNVTYQTLGGKALIDIAINREEVYEENSRIPFFKSYIMDIGDLSVFYGIEEFDCTGLELDIGLILDEELEYVSNLKESDLKKYHENGILFLRTNQKTELNDLRIPINLITNQNDSALEFNLNKPANFILKKNNEIKKIVLNGWFCDPNDLSKVKNGLVF